MSEKAADRGDEIIVTAGDESGETDVQKQEPIEQVEKVDEPKEVQIPKKRFDEAVGKARREAEAATKRAGELEEQLKAREGKIDAAKVETEIDELEDKLDAARADGNKELVAQLRKDIRMKMSQLSDARAEVKAAYATALAVEHIKYDAAVEAVERDHPELNPDHDDFDEELMTELLELKEAFEKAGQASSEALKRAVKTVYRGGEKPKREEKAGDDVDGKKKEVAAEAARKAAAVKKSLEAAGNQPASPGKGEAASDAAGKKGTPKDISKMTDKDFEKLDETERKRLRGDDV